MGETVELREGDLVLRPAKESEEWPQILFVSEASFDGGHFLLRGDKGREEHLDAAELPDEWRLISRNGLGALLGEAAQGNSAHSTPGFMFAEQSRR